MTVRKPKTHPNPTVSVVIPTIPENGYELCDTLQNQTIKDYEVLIVSNNSINICEARNRGIKKSQGDIIANTDDDCQPPSNWIEQIINKFEKKEDMVILGGRLDKHPSGPHDYVGANIAYRRAEAIKIGGFDQEMAGWRDDTDFGFRMEIEYGEHRCMFDPDLEVDHIGPLRTNVDRELERKFRTRYPGRYFKYLYPPNIIFGKWLGILIARLYRIFPLPIELMILIFRKTRQYSSTHVTHS